mmetsp:Transcript_1984/g.2291  ORF Transcript_1984/g.2291 Transcript_1984/m.2291 type:complete len:320 (-) Transcript_1984:349-1308(-)
MAKKVDIVWMSKGWLSLVPIFNRTLKKLCSPTISAHIRVAERTNDDKIILSSLEGAHVLIPTMQQCGIDELKAAGGNLQLVYQPAAGYDNINVEDCRSFGVPFCNCPGKNAVSTAEGAAMLILAMARKLPEGIEKVRNEATIGSPTGFVLRGKQLGVIGSGKIGKELENICGNGFGMQTCSVNSRSSQAEVDYLLKTSDVVSLHCPLTEKTRGLIGERELALMKKSAILINTARGHVVDKEAVTRALTDKQIKGYATDVFWDEPADPNDPFLDLQNVIVTPHILSSTTEFFEAVAVRCAENVLKVFGSQDLSNLEDRVV